MSDPPESFSRQLPTEKFHGKHALDAAHWIGDAWSWFILYDTNDEEWSAKYLLEVMAEDWGPGSLSASTADEVFPFMLELVAVLVDFAVEALRDGPPPDEFQERRTLSALKLILGGMYADAMGSVRADHGEATS